MIHRPELSSNNVLAFLKILKWLIHAISCVNALYLSSVLAFVTTVVYIIDVTVNVHVYLLLYKCLLSLSQMSLFYRLHCTVFAPSRRATRVLLMRRVPVSNTTKTF